ncbi:succinate dehydrogenase, cytochrome b556 subunit [Phenylobacterium sp.]|uniref:succinate dehydrogenase, cytochrome b556 subunit n=1 Tax=Phenylobacterium sp. TaxID=1871053 RepID=UPI002E35238A|nr:succinate dehydrogenase, cytochrome b556 subunit [Phenylobacterium sp.]HEX4712777.1 succinate dehydrogenase, cytochrome b556 subunit [Phenylobacterium sp.]
MARPTMRWAAAPWVHTEGIGSAFVDTPFAALKSGNASSTGSSGADQMTDAPKLHREPPISPHLLTGGLISPPLWRWHITMLTSILHRVTGMALYVGALIAAAWAIALAQGPEQYAQFKGLLGSLPGKVVMFGLTLSLFYHLANGVRHLVWDTGHGLDVKSANASAVLVLAFAAAATLAVWGIAGMTGAI